MPIIDLPDTIVAFAMVEDLATHMHRDFTDVETASAEQALAIASDTIRGFTRQTLSLVTDHVVVLRGTWESELVLPERPVISVASVKENGVLLTAGTWALTAGNLYRGRLPLVNGPDWDGPMVGNWGGPSTAIEVVYTHGFDPIPRDVAGLCMDMASRAAVVSEAGGIKSETVGPDSITYVTFDGATAGQLTAADMRYLRSAGYRR